MAKAWIYQDDKQVKKRGADKASWYVGWFDPSGKKRCKSCGPGAEGKKNAFRLRRQVEAELITGTYDRPEKVAWEEFRQEFDAKILGHMDDGTRRLTREALDNFERIVKPKKMLGIRTQEIDEYVAARRKEPGRRQGDTISPATVNKDLRHIKAALKIAHEWGFLETVPKIRMLKEPGQLPTYVLPDHFAAIYQACDQARRPKGQPYPAADWWRALLIFTYMTGWRIGAALALKREDLDLDAGTATSP